MNPEQPSHCLPSVLPDENLVQLLMLRAEEQPEVLR